MYALGSSTGLSLPVDFYWQTLCPASFTIHNNSQLTVSTPQLFRSAHFSELWRFVFHESLTIKRVKYFPFIPTCRIIISDFASSAAVWAVRRNRVSSFNLSKFNLPSATKNKQKYEIAKP